MSIDDLTEYPLDREQALKALEDGYTVCSKSQEWFYLRDKVCYVLGLGDQTR